LLVRFIFLRSLIQAMYTKRNYGFWLTFKWSKKPFVLGLFYALAVVLVQHFCKKHFNLDLSLPWQPISVMGIAVAFYLGFKNNASYDRTWEARKIWGGIVNSSRTLGMAILSFVQGENEKEVKQRLIYRHIAWMTALRYQLRMSREWEHTEDRVKGIYYPETSDKHYDHLEEELRNYLPVEEMEKVMHKSNAAAQIMLIQGQDLQALHNQGYFNDWRHMEMHKLLSALYDEQGRSERIKNFPFPRQYASAALWQTLLFALAIPFGLLNVFGENEAREIWVVVPLSALLIWVFFLMEKIGDYSENPFEGSYNDIPITTIARGIEIDLRQMLDDENIPGPIPNDHHFAM
jgi:ion channel-forming bestrophin family protein